MLPVTLNEVIIMSTKNPTLEEIALKAGVSKMTVSRVINHPESVNPETLGKILNLMEEMNFQPKFVARILAGSKPKTIGFVVHSNTDFIIAPFYGECVRAATEWLASQNYRHVLFNLIDSQSKSLFTDYTTSSLLDGLIVFEGFVDDDLISALKKSGIPTVLVGEQAPATAEYFSISSDNYGGAQVAVEYLISKGCRRIAYITGKGEKPSYFQRKKAYSDVLKANSIECEIVYETENSIEGGIRAANSLIDSNTGFDSIFCFSDLIALGVLKSLDEADMKIPDDVRVIGFDGLKFTKSFIPSLTTVSQNMKLMGQLAATSLLKIIGGKSLTKSGVVLPTSLTIRDSA